jgi:transposase-like protein
MEEKKQDQAESESLYERVPMKDMKGLTEEEKLKTIMMVLKKTKTQQEVSRETGVSRESVRKWKNRAINGMKEALKEQKKGRKTKDYIETEDDLRKEVERLKNELAWTRAEKDEAEKELKKETKRLWMARRVLNFWQRTGRLEIKKKSIIGKVIRNIFSDVPKRPYGPEETEASKESKNSVIQ